MIVNPFQQKDEIRPYAGTRILQRDLGVVGASLRDPDNRYRTWRVHALYSPIEGRAIGGIRAKLVDQKGFVTFINQMDLEVLLGIGAPGTRCAWAGRTYSAPDSRGFYGFAADADDLVDDLFDRELLLRGQTADAVLPDNSAINRRVLLDPGRDVHETFALAWDGDPKTGIRPDIRRATVLNRWVRTGRTQVQWEIL